MVILATVTLFVQSIAELLVLLNVPSRMSGVADPGPGWPFVKFRPISSSYQFVGSAAFVLPQCGFHTKVSVGCCGKASAMLTMAELGVPSQAPLGLLRST